MIRTDYRSIIKGYRKAEFYLRNFISYVIPDRIYRFFLLRKFHRFTEEERAYVHQRTAYYLRLSPTATIDTHTATRVSEFRYPFGKKQKYSAYFFDLFESIRCFHPNNRFHYLFGDVDHSLPVPTFVKTRPITDGYSNSALCRLNKVRHFRFLRDPWSFGEKSDKLVFRNIVCQQPQRTRFLQLYSQHPMCDAGQINPTPEALANHFVKPYMSIQEMLKFKFIACIEGHDVATNLKWVMSSNSIAVMPRPKIESWFMEGTLIGDYHYIEIKDDYSDLIDKLSYYLHHPPKAQLIIDHAHEYIRQFLDKDIEQCIQYEVVKRYFELTNPVTQRE